ncbi:MAG TPA: TlpA disulfide reductase family protein, partial [Lacipirellulaceae bacterium]|nr:TlpA disulfide reductase family protein [Lacipirellulaceae bacterium]
MLTPQQAFQLFVYADWAMGLVGVALLAAAVGLVLYAVLPKNKGRRRRLLLRTLACLVMFAILWGTQVSVLIPFVNNNWTPLLIVLFALPAVFLISGLIASIAYGAVAVLRRTGRDRRQAALKALLGVVVFGVSITPHTVATLMPIISYQDHANHPGTLAHAGERAPDFRLTRIDGTPIQSSDLRGNMVVLNFFATWCGPCQMELPHLQSIWEEFGSDSHFRMLIVGREETDDTVRAFQHKNGFTFPMAADPKGSVYKKFATEYIPRTYLISADGTIAFETTGFYEPELARLKKLITRQLAKTRRN